VKEPSGILLMHGRYSSIIISVDHGGLDSVIYLGFAKKTQNTGFNSTRNDSEFYKWSYIKPNDSQTQEAVVMKEYLTGSLEKKGLKYYFFDIVNTNISELQIYAYLFNKIKKQ
jgi:hypothetical protein